MFKSIAATKLSDLLRPNYVGNTVNSHVIEAAREPGPDFDAMNRAIKSVQSNVERGPTPSERRTNPAK